MTSYRQHTVLVSGLGFPESLRWHDDTLWYADWAAGEISRLTAGDASPEVVARRSTFPLCFDLRPTTAGPQPVTVADLPGLAGLAGVGEHPWNEVLCRPDGSTYVNNIGFAYDGSVDASAAGAVGFVALVRPDGSVEVVADGLAFPNGMALVEDGRTLLVAESWASRLSAYDVGEHGTLGGRRVWAETPGLHPDGIDAHHVDGQWDGSVWLADVGTRCCARVAEGGEILDRVDLPESAFDCVVGDLGSGPTLYVAVNAFGEEVGGGDSSGGPAGKILAVPVSP